MSHLRSESWNNLQLYQKEGSTRSSFPSWITTRRIWKNTRCILKNLFNFVIQMTKINLSDSVCSIEKLISSRRPNFICVYAAIIFSTNPPHKVFIGDEMWNFYKLVANIPSEQMRSAGLDERRLSAGCHHVDILYIHSYRTLLKVVPANWDRHFKLRTSSR